MDWLQEAIAAGFNEKDRLAERKETDSVRDRAAYRKSMAKSEAKRP
jgi:hypothetical protein